MNADAFHAHLDVCERCRANPFNMGPTGNLLLRGHLVGENLAQTPCKALGDTTDELFDALNLDAAASAVAPDIPVQQLKDAFRTVFDPQGGIEAVRKFRP